MNHKPFLILILYMTGMEPSVGNGTAVLPICASEYVENQPFEKLSSNSWGAQGFQK
jgi:hypothetical protein